MDIKREQQLQSNDENNGRIKVYLSGGRETASSCRRARKREERARESKVQDMIARMCVRNAVVLEKCKFVYKTTSLVEPTSTVGL